MSEWIEFSGENPFEDQDCWVCQHDNNITRGSFMYDHELFGDGFYSHNEFIKSKYVKCWMKYCPPIPPDNSLYQNNGDK